MLAEQWNDDGGQNAERSEEAEETTRESKLIALLLPVFAHASRLTALALHGCRLANDSGVLAANTRGARFQISVSEVVELVLLWGLVRVDPAWRNEPWRECLSCSEVNLVLNWTTLALQVASS